MRLEYAGCSETGLVRTNNEDAILMRDCGEAGLFLVADGIGGRTNGEVVSAKIRDTYDRWWETQFLPEYGRIEFRTAVQQIKDTLLQINREVVQTFGEMNAGSTLVLLFVYGRNCVCFSSGDSRIYRLRKLSLKQITRDDAYQAEDAAHADQNGKLLSAVGIWSSLEFAMRTDGLRAGECFFLCSDGVYRYVKPSVLYRKTLSGKLFSAPERVTEMLEREVLKNGAGDNYSCIFIKIRR